MAYNMFNDLLHIDKISKDARTDNQFKNLLKNFKKEYFSQTPKFEVEFKKPLSNKRIYYTYLIENETKKQLNKCFSSFNINSTDIHYKYLFSKYYKPFSNYLKEIATYIKENKLSEDQFLNPSQDTKSNEAYIIYFLKANAIMLIMELQERFHKYSEVNFLLQEEIHEVYFSENPPENLYVQPYQGEIIQIKEHPKKSKLFKAIKGDLENRNENNRLLNYVQIINSSKTTLFARAEEKLNEAEIIDNNYNFIPAKGNKILLAAFIIKLYYCGYFNERIFPGAKQIKERDLTKYFANRYGNGSDTNKEFRNFKGIKKHQYKSIIESKYWLDNIN